jgi:molecular chaperone GrpE
MDVSVQVLQAKADEYLAGWQRERADFANYKRRVEREMRESFINGGLDAIKKVLPLVDDFERAVENVPQHLKGEPWLNGTELLLNKLHKLLTEYNVEVLDPLGEAFDPNRHQAIAMDDSGDGTSGHVTEVLQKGYVCGERVLRPAMVRVAV